MFRRKFPEHGTLLDAFKRYGMFHHLTWKQRAYDDVIILKFPEYATAGLFKHRSCMTMLLTGRKDDRCVDIGSKFQLARLFGARSQVNHAHHTLAACQSKTHDTMTRQSLTWFVDVD